MDSLGERIAHARREASLTQHSLGSRTDIREGSISRYERNEMSPSVDALVRIARACGVSVEWLATGDGDGPANGSLESTGTDG